VQIIVLRQDSEIINEKDIYFARQTTSDYNGKFTLKFIVNDNDRNTWNPLLTAVFTVVASSTDAEKTSIDFEYVHPMGKQILLDEINEIKSNETELKELLSDENNLMILRSMDMMIDEYLALETSLMDKATSLFCKYSEDYTEESWSDETKDAVCAMLLNTADSSYLFEEMLGNDEIIEKINLVFENVSYTLLETESKKFFLKLATDKAKENEFESLSELDLLFKQAMALDKLNNANYHNIYNEVFEKYSEILELDVNEDYEYLRENSDKVRDAVIKSFKTKTESFESVDDVKKALSEAVEDYKNKKNESTSGGSGGGGGGGGSSSGGRGSSQDASGYYPPVLPEENNKPAEKVTMVSFDDVETVAWAEEAINTLAGLNVINGVGENKFEPNRLVTRAEFIKMLISMLDFEDKNAECSFDDVLPNDWSYTYIASAYSLGITGGLGNNIFGKDKPITREEMAVFTHRAAVRAYLPVTDKMGKTFDDDTSIADWAKRSVSLMRGAGIINGTGENVFSPRLNATRAEAAKIIYGLYQQM